MQGVGDASRTARKAIQEWPKPSGANTNILSDLIHNPQGLILAHIRKVGEAEVCTRILVTAELRFAAAKKGSPRLTAQLEAVLRVLAVIPWEVPADATYGRLRAQLEKKGKPIGANDLLIAAQAMTFGYTLVTDNEREFAQIAELRRENWLREN